jgi:hypothetical protein
MRNRRMPAWLALLLAAVPLCAVLLAVAQQSRQPPPPPPFLEAARDFELHDGESIALRTFSITATGGFHGYKRGAGKTGDFLVFVRGDGPWDSEKAWVTVWRDADIPPFGVLNFSFGPGWTKLHQPLEWSGNLPPQTWLVHGIYFRYVTFKGEGERAGRQLTYVGGRIGTDLVTFILQCPASAWPEAFDGLAALVATVRPTEKGR